MCQRICSHLAGGAVAFSLVFFLSAPLHALCVQSGPACAEYWRAKIVFDGFVEGWDDGQRPGYGGQPMPARLVLFRVEHAWKGLPPERQTIRVRTLGGKSSDGKVLWVEDQWEFKKGQRYLVWAYPTEDGGEVATDRCSLTKEIERSREDLAFLEALSRPAAGGRVYGRVTRSDVALRPGTDSAREPMSGISIRLDGAGISRETRTDSAGDYQFRNLEAGKYVVSASIPHPYRVPDERLPVEVPDVRGCAEAAFFPRTDGMIGGVVIGADGRPADHVRLEAVLAEVYDAAREMFTTVQAGTDAAGRFGFTDVPPGRYLVGVNLRMGPTDYSPWPRLLHPGTALRSEATSVELAAGQHTDIGVFRLPAALVKVPLAGQVVWPDGRQAAADVLARCTYQGGYAAASGTHTSDEGGLFTLSVFETTSCAVVATVYGPDRQVTAEARSGPISVSREAPAPLRLVLGPPVRR